jgi:secreted trypsin-like serine protease
VSDKNDDYEVIAIKRHYPHPYFLWDVGSFDQMVLLLVNSTESPLLNINFDSDVPNKKGQDLNVIGFGVTEMGGLSTKLQEVTVGYVENNECAKAKNDGASYKDEITPDMICIYSDNEGQCNGDSGGPYIILGDSFDEDLQVGIVSW